jgi:hypothetical protein
MKAIDIVGRAAYFALGFVTCFYMFVKGMI